MPPIYKDQDMLDDEFDRKFDAYIDHEYEKYMEREYEKYMEQKKKELDEYKRHLRYFGNCVRDSADFNSRNSGNCNWIHVCKINDQA